MNSNNFEKLVKKAVIALPKNIREKMDNVAIVVKKRSSGSLLGLYQGIPQTTWGRRFGMRLPDKITIFQDSIERMARSEKEIPDLVKYVVWHEIAHHFGLDEKRIRELEAKWKNKK